MTQGTLIMLACAAACGHFKGKADTVAFDPEYQKNGWKRKWKLGDITQEPRYHKYEYKNAFMAVYYALANIKYAEKFPFSSTFLVAFTDKLHLFNWCMWRCIEVMVLVLSGYDWWATIWFAVIRGIAFHYSFRRK